MEIVVAGFKNEGEIPKLHTCDGKNVSPAIEWSGEPRGTRSFALLLDDPDAPAGTWNHWLLYDLAADVHKLAEGVRDLQAGRSGVNDFGKLGYGGPCPPRGHGPHRYYFRLFALDVPSLETRSGPKRPDLDRAMIGHVLERAEYMGRYERR